MDKCRYGTTCMNIIESIRVIIARLINYNHLMTVNDKNYKHPIAELPNFLKTKKTFSWKWDRPFFTNLQF